MGEITCYMITLVTAYLNFHNLRDNDSNRYHLFVSIKCIIFWLLTGDIIANDFVGNFNEHLNPVNGAWNP